MKKILFLLISIPLIFSSCEKEEENPSTNTTNNTSLTLDQTIWEVTSFEQTIGTNSPTTINIPCGDNDWDSGLNSVRWTFVENNNTILVKIVNGNNSVDYDTLSYSYFPENNIISIQVLTTRFMSEGMLDDDLDFNILEHTTNNLVVKQDGITSTSSFNWKFKTSLTKVQ